MLGHNGARPMNILRNLMLTGSNHERIPEIRIMISRIK